MPEFVIPVPRAGIVHSLGQWIYQLPALSLKEFDHLRSQFGTSSWGGRRKLPYAFTEQGVAMLSGVLHSDRAIKVNIQIMRIFTRMRKKLETHTAILKKLDDLERKDIEHDKKILLIFEFLKQLEQAKQQELEQRSQKRVGIIRMDEDQP